MRFLILIALLLAATPAHAANAFRNFIWGASPEDVMKFETAKFYKEEDGSLYFIELPKPKNDFRRVIRYDFQNKKLWRGTYEFQELVNENPNNILNMYEDFKIGLEKQYGKAEDEVFIWKDKTYLNYPQFWGRALYSNDLKVRTEWQLPDTEVKLEVYFTNPYYALNYSATQSSVANQKSKANLLDVPVVRPDAVTKP